MNDHSIDPGEQQPTAHRRATPAVGHWCMLAESCVRDAIAKGLGDPHVEIRRITMRPNRAIAPGVSASLAFTELVSEIIDRMRQVRETELEMRVAVRGAQREVLCRMTFRVYVRARSEWLI